MRPLAAGKIPIDVLDATFLKHTGAESADVVTPPLAGLDFAVLRAGGRFMVISADPITGVVRDIGRYAVIVSANDVATSGNRPQFAESVVLLPEGADERYARTISNQMHLESKKLGIAIVGGHTEVTPGLHRPIVVVTAFSFVDDYVSSRDAREGDTMMMTKTAGLEGTAVLGGGSKSLGELIVVDEAVAAYRTGYVHAMHDCTEGGTVGAAFEMSLASKVGFEMNEELVPVAPETKRVCARNSLDPLRLIGSGSLLLSVDQGKEKLLQEALRPICKATAIGSFVRGGRTLVKRDGTRQSLVSAPEDELWRALSGRARSRNGS